MKPCLNNKFYFFPILIFILILSSCTTSQPEIQPVVSITHDISQTLPTVTEEIKTPVVTPQVKNIIFLKKDENLSNEETDIKIQLDQFAQSIEANFVMINDFEESSISDAALVVIINPEGNWIDQSAFFNNATFLFISDKQLALPENGYQIKLLPSEYYFLAGYTAALISSDWRVGGLLADTSFNNTSTAQLFSNGMHFFCGLCFPVYTPLVSFPVTASLNLTANPDSIISAIGELSVNRPEIIFIQSEFLTTEVLTSLKNDGLIIISNQPFGSDENVSPDFSIYQDISSIFTQFLKTFGENPQKVMPADFLIESNNSLLSAGKLDYLKIVINDLREGFIYPASTQE